MIELKNFGIGYGKRVLLSDVNAVFAPGTLVALLGRNGMGKSTLLRAIAGLGPHTSGTVEVDGRDMARMDAAATARTLAFVSTERVRVPSLRCSDIVAMGRAPYTNWIGSMTDADRAVVADSLAAVGMDDFASRTMDTMSDGECQRIMIARALTQDTPVILLDEPTSFLDLPNRYELCLLLRRLAHERGDLGRRHGIAFVRAARVHFERAGHVRHHGFCLFADRGKIVFFHFDGGADGMHAEHAADFFDHAAIVSRAADEIAPVVA